MEIYDLYGFKLNEIEKALEAVESALGIEMQVSENLSRGIYYRKRLSYEGEHFILKRNIDFTDREFEKNLSLADPKFPDYPILLYVNNTKRSEELKKVLTEFAGFTLLCHQVL